ncbi:hypothetical protein [Streptomyces sp. NPDC058718]|uniref:hypothetical protein n=1 Tax=Streptomyces sp. NPDC058718 TaxID=3346610 RepID=UPI0036C6BED0
MTARVTKARLFRSLHVPGTPLVLPHAWDAASARVVAEAGQSRATLCVPSPSRRNGSRQPAAPRVSALADAGVARVSAGSSIAEAAYALVRRAARELMAQGTTGALEDGFDHAELNALLLAEPSS